MVCNEPDIPFWNRTEYEYFTLYVYAVPIVLEALTMPRVGGAEVAGSPHGD